ncbi:NMA111, partial [Symbiodinium sp. KB8]
MHRDSQVRSYEDCAAGVWDGTGFVVSLENPKEALILTNRHIITTGPIRARATFYEHDDLPIWPVYRDPVHDFGLFQFDSTELRFTPPTAISVSPPELRVGTEVLVIGNDNAEKIQILPATIARVDRNCPEYHDNYEDENTFYAGAGSNTSGGSSGSPVIARSGNCIALNAGGAHEAASAFFLPLDRAVYVLEWLKGNPNQIPLPPRGTLLARWLFQPFDMLRRLGFTPEQEADVLKLSEDAAMDDRQKGLLVVENLIRGSEAEQPRYSCGFGISAEFFEGQGMFEFWMFLGRGFAFGECWYKLYESVTESFENEAPYLAVWLHGGDWGNISKRDLQTMQWRMGRRTIWMVPKSPKSARSPKGWEFQWGCCHKKEDNRNDQGFIWGHLHSSFLTAFAETIGNVAHRFQADRVLAFGYSMGGFGAYQVASWSPEVFDAVVSLAGYGLGTEDPQHERFRAPQPQSGQIFRDFVERYGTRMAKVPVVLAVHAWCDSLSSYNDDCEIIWAVKHQARREGLTQHVADMITVPECLANTDLPYSSSGHDYYYASLLRNTSERLLWSKLRTALWSAPRRQNWGRGAKRQWPSSRTSWGQQKWARRRWKLKPGDVLLEIAGRPCLNFVTLEDQLDSEVDKEVLIKISRAGDVLKIGLRVVDFHKLISHDFVECGGGVFHVLSYHTCKTYNIPISDRGIYVAQSGFSFGLQIPVSAVITSVAGKRVTSLKAFETALAGIPNKEMFEVRWFNPSANEHRQKCSMIRMERTLWPARVWDFCPKRPNTWQRRSWDGEVADDKRGAAAATTEPVECSPVSDARSRASAEQDADVGPAALSGQEDSFGYPENSDAAISMVQPMLCTIVTQVSHEYATDFLQSKEENKSTVIRRCGVGLVIDSAAGLVLTDRYTVPQPLVEVELTFGQTVTVNATCLFMHPHHNMVLLHYAPTAVKDLPVRSIDLSDVAAGDATKTDELSAGQILSFVSIHSDHQLSAKQVTVGSMCLKVWPFPQPPAYRGRNLEICNLNDTLHGLGGLLIEPAPSYRIRAWFAQFPAGSLRYLAGVPVQVFAAVLASLGLPLQGSWAGKRGPAVDPTLAVAALECEFEEVSLAKARREDGVPLENARALAACSSGGRRHILRVGRITSGGGCDGVLLEGDLILSINGKPVTKPHEVEREMRKCHVARAEVNSMSWRVQRSRQPVDLDLRPTLLHSDGTEHIVVFNGVVLRPTPRAVAERGGPTLPFTRPGQGLYFWYIYPGSPADTFSFADSRAMRNLGWLVQLNNEPTPSIERLLEIIHSGALSGCLSIQPSPVSAALDEEAAREKDSEELFRIMAVQHTVEGGGIGKLDTQGHDSTANTRKAVGFFRQLRVSSLRPDLPALTAAIGATAAGLLWKSAIDDSDWVECLFRELNLNRQFELCFGALRVVLCLDVPIAARHQLELGTTQLNSGPGLGTVSFNAKKLPVSMITCSTCISPHQLLQRCMGAGLEYEAMVQPLRAMGVVLTQLLVGDESRRNVEFDESSVPAPEEDFHVVEKGDNIAEYEAFLSDAEVKYLLAFVEGVGWGASSAPGAQLPVEGYIAAARMDPVISRIEKRIANITGVPAHPHEDILSIVRTNPRNLEPRGGYFPPAGLRHDSDSRPHRSWTLLVFLEVPEEGGRIIFPVAGPAPRDGEQSERHRQFHRGLQEQFGGAKQNYSRSVRFDPSMEHPFMDLIEESCRGSYGVAVTPKPGSALLFPSDSASRRTWYGECNVINGSKVTLQKYKELPLAQRDPEDPVPPYQPWRF